MVDVNSITKEQFDTAYNKFPANAWTKFVFKYFSKGTEQKNLIVSNSIRFSLLGLFFLGFLLTALKLSHALIVIITLIFFGILFLLGIGTLSARIMNKLRINKIAKTLGITIEEYNSLVVKFYS